MNISVALCTYNGSAYLEAQLDSILSQSRRPDEIVVCDDGSSDVTPAILEDYQREHPDLFDVHLNDENLGVTKNFERAISLCSGDLIAISDQDDVWHPEKIERQVAAMEEQGADLVCHDSQIVSDDLEPRGRLWDRHIGSFDPTVSRTPTETFRELARRNVVQGASMLFRASYRDVVLPIPKRWQYDHYVALLVAATGCVHFLPERLLKYRQHQDQDIGESEHGGVRRLFDEIDDRFDIDAAHLADVAEDWRVLRRRLDGIDPDTFTADREAVVDICRRKQRYARDRQRIYDRDHSRLWRTCRVLEFFANDRYDGFADRWTSAPKDLLVTWFR